MSESLPVCVISPVTQMSIQLPEFSRWWYSCACGAESCDIADEASAAVAESFRLEHRDRCVDVRR